MALGSGLLTAAAVSFASRLPDLVKLGAEAIRIAFRMGLRVDQVSQRLESRRAEGPAESWAYVFSELSEDEVRKELASMNASLVSVPSNISTSTNTARTSQRRAKSFLAPLAPAPSPSVALPRALRPLCAPPSCYAMPNGLLCPYLPVFATQPTFTPALMLKPS